MIRIIHYIFHSPLPLQSMLDMIYNQTCSKRYNHIPFFITKKVVNTIYK